jgi:hypothetical protein
MSLTTCLTARYLRLAFLAVALAARLAHAEAVSIEIVDANPALGFNFPYALRIPAQLRSPQLALVVETNNTGNTDDFAKTLEATKAAAAGNSLGPLVSEALKIPLLIPVFPRTEAQPLVYTHALDRDTVLIETGALARLDKQLLAMIDDARSRLARRGIDVAPKVLMCGFSASGSFANRFAFLHPNRLLGVVSGGINAFPMLPVATWRGASLSFPLGTKDLQKLAGPDYDLEAWRALPQLIFMGSDDDNDAVRFPDAYSGAERATIYRVVGKSMALRWQTAQEIYRTQDPSVTFITYGRVGHRTDGRINRDVINFMSSILSKADH